MATTLTSRESLIDDVVHRVELAFPSATTAFVFELASHRLALAHGLVVTPDEIRSVLSRAAGFMEGPL